jgi:hypothetical protein
VAPGSANTGLLDGNVDERRPTVVTDVEERSGQGWLHAEIEEDVQLQDDLEQFDCAEERPAAQPSRPCWVEVRQGVPRIDEVVSESDFQDS